MAIMTDGCRIILIVAAMLGAIPASADPSHPAFSNGASPARTIALEVLARQAGGSLAAEEVHVAEVDLDADGRPEIIAYGFADAFCNADGCQPQILRDGGSGWTNVLSDGVVRTHGIGSFVVVDKRRNGFSDLLVGSLYLINDGTTYRENTGPVRTKLNDIAFLNACTGSGEMFRDVEAAGPRPDMVGPVDVYCLCLVDLFENAGMEQRDLDGFSAMLGGTPAEVAAKMSSRPDNYLATVADFRFSCGIDLSVD